MTIFILLEDNVHDNPTPHGLQKKNATLFCWWTYIKSLQTSTKSQASLHHLNMHKLFLNAPIQKVDLEDNKKMFMGFLNKIESGNNNY